jgi:hypothetical protein
MKLKRDNWTNEEVIRILENQKMIIDADKLSDQAFKFVKNWNNAINQCVFMFRNFSKPVIKHMAMAYDIDDKKIFFVGPKLPQIKTCNPRQNER